MTNRRLKTLLAKWIKRLCLNEWKVNLAFLPSEKMQAKGCAGSTYWEPEYKTAHIEIASDLPEDCDVEETLIHELLHVALEGHKVLTRGYRYDPQYERGLNVIAEALKAGNRR